MNRVGSQVQHGSNNILAGRDVIFNAPREEAGKLEITKVSFTDEAEFDIIVRNTGDVDLVIHEIQVGKLFDFDSHVSPILEPSARYVVHADAISVGKTKILDVAHVVAARKAERFRIALNTTSCYLLQVELVYDDNQRCGFTRETCGSRDESEDSFEAIEFSRRFLQMPRDLSGRD